MRNVKCLSLILVGMLYQTSLAVANELSSSDATLANEPIKPIPLSLDLDLAKVELGKKLFYDKRLSGDNTMSCASCHDTDKGMADGKKYSTGVGGAKGSINSPTLYNVAFNFLQLWDGRATSLEKQVGGALKSSTALVSNWDDTIEKLSKDEHYKAEILEIYKSDVTPETVSDAVAEYERSLITPNSRFDQYLRGNKTAINSQERNGYRLFKGFGCSSCHQGVNVGGNMFQKFGVMHDYFKGRNNLNKTDLGRYIRTKRERDKYVFKVPSLRNIALTAPYFHDGSVNDLNSAVEVMAKYQLGRVLNSEERDDIVAFLRTLTGKYKGQQL